ncbi:MAG: 5-(carboxyamino)imidazole ribonucleotide mutase [Nitrososphaerales archaeon]
MGEAPICIIAGSKSDAEYVKRAEDVLSKLNLKYDVAYLSAHRNPEDLDIYVSNSKADVFVAIAGLSAHLPGYIASRTVKPVIGVPINKALAGLDSLLSIVQMPRGVPVACVGVDNPENGALLAAEILGLKDPSIQEKVMLYRRGKL